MKPYYEQDGITIYHGDCRDVLPQLGADVVLTDPPYNVGYHYASYGDDLSASDYLNLLRVIPLPAVVIHYPEGMFQVAQAFGIQPTKCAAWTYNGFTPRKWRMVAWFACCPDFGAFREAYKNPTDARIRARMERGIEGAASYDWWHDEQVKNVSGEKTEHPCQIPLDVMRRILTVTAGDLAMDPFMGSGTTLRAAKDLGRRAIGIEIEERYCEVAARRLDQTVLAL